MSEVADRFVYTLTVVLRGISSMIWRRLLGRGDSINANLQDTVHAAMAWTAPHGLFVTSNVA